jgi:hypothetical protein
VPNVPPVPVRPADPLAAKRPIPPKLVNNAATAADLDPAPALFTALVLNFNLPPELKKYLA